MIKKGLLPLIFALLFIFLPNISAQAKEADPDPTDTLSLIQKVEKWYENNMNYASITALMTVESSFIPFPSELVVPPAAYVASKPESKLNLFLVVIFATLGSLLGAYINYFLALWLGRPIVHKLADSKWGKIMLLSSEKVQKAEDYFNKNGNASTFIGRLIPGIRQLISLPAGLAKMNFVSFTLYTLLGAGIWNVILTLMGYLAHGQADLINKYSHELSIIILTLLVLVATFFVVKYFVKKKGKKEK